MQPGALKYSTHIDIVMYDVRYWYVERQDGIYIRQTQPEAELCAGSCGWCVEGVQSTYNIHTHTHISTAHILIKMLPEALTKRSRVDECRLRPREALMMKHAPYICRATNFNRISAPLLRTRWKTRCAGGYIACEMATKLPGIAIVCTWIYASCGDFFLCAHCRQLEGLQLKTYFEYWCRSARWNIFKHCEEWYVGWRETIVQPLIAFQSKSLVEPE